MTPVAPIPAPPPLDEAGLREIILLRIAGRMHNEVVSHITIDDGKTILCGRKDLALELDDCYFDIEFAKLGLAYGYMGRITIVHRLCRTCLKRLIEVAKREVSR